MSWQQVSFQVGSIWDTGFDVKMAAQGGKAGRSRGTQRDKKGFGEAWALCYCYECP